MILFHISIAKSQLHKQCLTISTRSNNLHWFGPVPECQNQTIWKFWNANRTTKPFRLNRYKKTKPLKLRIRGSILVFKLGQNSKFKILKYFIISIFKILKFFPLNVRIRLKKWKGCLKIYYATDTCRSCFLDLYLYFCTFTDILSCSVYSLLVATSLLSSFSSSSSSSICYLRSSIVSIWLLALGNAFDLVITKIGLAITKMPFLR